MKTYIVSDFIWAAMGFAMVMDWVVYRTKNLAAAVEKTTESMAQFTAAFEKANKMTK